MFKAIYSLREAGTENQAIFPSIPEARVEAVDCFEGENTCMALAMAMDTLDSLVTYRQKGRHLIKLKGLLGTVKPVV